MSHLSGKVARTVRISAEHNFPWLTVKRFEESSKLSLALVKDFQMSEKDFSLPYCVDGEEFRPMLQKPGWFICELCGHVLLPGRCKKRSFPIWRKGVAQIVMKLAKRCKSTQPAAIHVHNEAFDLIPLLLSRPSNRHFGTIWDTNQQLESDRQRSKSEATGLPQWRGCESPSLCLLRLFQIPLGLEGDYVTVLPE